MPRFSAESFGKPAELWMDKIRSRHFETIGHEMVRWFLRGNHHSRVFLGGAGFRPSTVANSSLFAVYTAMALVLTLWGN